MKLWARCGSPSPLGPRRDPSPLQRFFFVTGLGKIGEEAWNIPKWLLFLQLGWGLPWITAPITVMYPKYSSLGKQIHYRHSSLRALNQGDHKWEIQGSWSRSDWSNENLARMGPWDQFFKLQLHRRCHSRSPHSQSRGNLCWRCW